MKIDMAFRSLPVALLIMGGVAFLLTIPLSEIQWLAGPVYTVRNLVFDDLGFDENGKPMIIRKDSESSNQLQYHEISGATLTLSMNDKFNGATPLPKENFSRPLIPGWSDFYTRNLVIRLDMDNGPYWYLHHNGQEKGLAYFKGCDGLPVVDLGYLTKKGPSENLPSESMWFPVSCAEGYFLKGRIEDPDRLGGLNFTFWKSGIFYLAADDGLYWIDLKAREVKSVLSFRPGEKFLSRAKMRVYRGDGCPIGTDAIDAVTYIRTTQRLIILDIQNPDKVVEYPLPPSLQDAEKIFGYGNQPQGFCIASDSSPVSSSKGVERVRTLLFFNREGSLAATHEVVLQGRYDTKRGEVVTTMRSEYYSQFGLIGSLFTFFSENTRPVEFQSYSMTRGSDLIRLPDDDPAVVQWRSIRYRYALAGAAFALFLALLAWLWECRFYTTRTAQITWSVFVLLFGLSGLIGYLTHRKWPVRLPCGHCGTRFPVTTTVCPRCSTPVLLPEHTEKEVFV